MSLRVTPRNLNERTCSIGLLLMDSRKGCMFFLQFEWMSMHMDLVFRGLTFRPFFDIHMVARSIICGLESNRYLTYVIATEE